MNDVKGGGGLGRGENLNDKKQAWSFLLILIPVGALKTGKDPPTVTHRQEIVLLKGFLYEGRCSLLTEKKTL
jgi:hypothetical protein